MKKSQIARIVDFDHMVRDGVYPNKVRFAADYEVSERTVGRDIEYIRYQLGAPLEYCPTRRGFYYGDVWELPQVVSVSADKADGLAGLIEALMPLSTAEKRAIISALHASLKKSLDGHDPETQLAA
jgi:predicted DNA-binding transcriptional regulator YafY